MRHIIYSLILLVFLSCNKSYSPAQKWVLTKCNNDSVLKNKTSLFLSKTFLNGKGHFLLRESLVINNNAILYRRPFIDSNNKIYTCINVGHLNEKGKHVISQFMFKKDSAWSNIENIDYIDQTTLPWIFNFDNVNKVIYKHLYLLRQRLHINKAYANEYYYNEKYEFKKIIYYRNGLILEFRPEL